MIAIAKEWNQMPQELKDQFKKRATEINERMEMKLEENNSNTATLVTHSAMAVSLNGDGNQSDSSSEVSSIENSEATIKNSEINQFVNSNCSSYELDVNIQ